MLTIHNLSVSFGDQEVLHDFNLSVKPGEVVALVGESGSGKTTAIRSMFSLLPHEGKMTSGTITLEGESLAEKTAKEWSHLRGKEMAMIFQDSGAMLNPISKIKKQFIEYLRLHEHMTKQEAYDRAVEMLAATHLPDPKRVMESYPFELSGGMRQRVGIALAMSFHPKILLADEPTSALDATTQKQIVAELMQLQQKHNTAIVIVTHNLGLAVHMAQNIVVMKDGAIVETGNPEDILNHSHQEYTKKLLAAMPNAEEGSDYV